MSICLTVQGLFSASKYAYGLASWARMLLTHDPNMEMNLSQEATPSISTFSGVDLYHHISPEKSLSKTTWFGWTPREYKAAMERERTSCKLPWEYYAMLWVDGVFRNTTSNQISWSHKDRDEHKIFSWNHRTEDWKEGLGSLGKAFKSRSFGFGEDVWYMKRCEQCPIFASWPFGVYLCERMMWTMIRMPGWIHSQSINFADQF